MSRRTFMERLTALAGVEYTTALVPMLQNNYTHAETVPVSDARLETGKIDFPGAAGKTVR